MTIKKFFADFLCGRINVLKCFPLYLSLGVALFLVNGVVNVLLDSKATCANVNISDICVKETIYDLARIEVKKVMNKIFNCGYNVDTNRHDFCTLIVRSLVILKAAWFFVGMGLIYIAWYQIIVNT